MTTTTTTYETTIGPKGTGATNIKFVITHAITPTSNRDTFIDDIVINGYLLPE
jgi:hypothetical protein